MYSEISFPSLGLTLNPPSSVNLGPLSIHFYGLNIATGLMLAVIIPAAFSFARLEFKGRNVAFALLLSLMIFQTMPNPLFFVALVIMIAATYLVTKDQSE